MLVYVDKERLRQYREEKCYSCHQLSIEAGLGKNAVKQMETGLHTKSSLLRINAIANVLGVNSSQLIIKPKNNTKD